MQFIDAYLMAISTTVSQTFASLAIDGGRPLRSRPFAPRPSFSSDEVEAAKRALESSKVNYWTGDEGRQFEAEFAAFSGSRHSPSRDINLGKGAGEIH
jgi:hypothetical protein